MEDNKKPNQTNEEYRKREAIHEELYQAQRKKQNLEITSVNKKMAEQLVMDGEENQVYISSKVKCPQIKKNWKLKRRR